MGMAYVLSIKLHQRRWVSAARLVLTEVSMTAFTFIQINSTKRLIALGSILIKPEKSELKIITYSVIFLF